MDRGMENFHRRKEEPGKDILKKWPEMQMGKQERMLLRKAK